tara:strand:+ start:634 stop:864 length:231 start_codon:yes stop_codon:yes gene_type:complete
MGVEIYMLSSAGLKTDTKLESFQWSKAEPYTIPISGFLIYSGRVRFKVCNSHGRIMDKYILLSCHNSIDGVLFKYR